MIDDALTGTVIGCAMDVHRELGPGYLEKVYENALAIALSDAGIGVAQQVAVPAQFRGRVVGDFVADLLVEGNLIVELKAVSNLLPVHETQLVSYLKATGFDVGLLINFGAGSLQVKRKYREYRPALATNQDRITGFSGRSRPGLGLGDESRQDYRIFRIHRKCFPKPRRSCKFWNPVSKRSAGRHRSRERNPQNQSCQSCKSCNPVKNTRAGRRRAPQEQSC